MSISLRNVAILTSLAGIIPLLGISSPTYAQKLMLGPRGGIDIGTVAWDTSGPYGYGIEKGSTLGFIGGIQLDVWFSSNVALSTGALLDQQGWRETPGYPNAPSEKHDFTLDYIEFPILLKLAFGVGTIQPYVSAGPSVGYLVSGFTSNPFVGTFSIANLLNKINLSIVGSAGVALNLSEGQQVFIDAGYSFGLVNILNGQNYYDEFGVTGVSSPGVTTMKTRDVQLETGILFPI